MRKLINISLFLAFPFYLGAQEHSSEGGTLSLGIRSTLNVFANGEHSTNVSTGVGGQFGLQLNDRVNTLWFADYIRSAIQQVANRTDYHIGWSVMYYPFKSNNSIRPFAHAGHCFDYAKISENLNPNFFLERWSSAIHMGIGSHFYLAPKFDISLASQYMFHLGSDIHASVVGDRLILEKEEGLSSESHILITISINYKIADLWK